MAVSDGIRMPVSRSDFGISILGNIKNIKPRQNVEIIASRIHGIPRCNFIAQAVAFGCMAGKIGSILISLRAVMPQASGKRPPWQEIPIFLYIKRIIFIPVVRFDRIPIYVKSCRPKNIVPSL